jgi:hypothetical protein
MCGLGDAGELIAGLLVSAEVGECASVTEIGDYLRSGDIGRAIRVGSIRDLAECHQGCRIGKW